MPFEDRKAWATVLGFIGEYRPDCVIQLGHLMNLPPFGRFTGQATIELRRRELMGYADYVRRSYLSRLHTVHKGPLRIIYSAASTRLAAILQRKAFRDTGAAATCVESLVQLDCREGVELSNTYTPARGWTVLYGDTLAAADSDIPGTSAMRIAIHLGVCAIVGHTMRLGKGTYTVTHADGSTHTVTGVEVGNLIDPTHVTQASGRSHRWQQGFAILETDGSSTSAECVLLTNGRLTARALASAPAAAATQSMTNDGRVQHRGSGVAISRRPGDNAPSTSVSPSPVTALLPRSPYPPSQELTTGADHTG
jgi:hypothetical protein